MVGLEVHQQLLTERKLFCNCPAGRYTTSHDGIVLRHMRPTLSELGVYDGTALMEFKTRKQIVYLLNGDNVCTYEMDDTPPFLVNQQAVDIAIEQCLMLGCDIVDEVHIARKQYLDGSIPTGFQRTAIVGVDGRLPFRGRELSITQVSVEEDSCREVSDNGHLIVWRTDRLGMPLIETVTGPDLRTPDEVEEAILLIGRVCRSTGHVRVGLGASRQDVNVSRAGRSTRGDQGRPAGWLGAAPRPRRGGAAGEPAEAARRAASTRLHPHRSGRRRQRGRHGRLRHIEPRGAAERSLGKVGRSPTASPRLRARGGSLPRPGCSPQRARVDAVDAHPAGPPVRRRAGGPGAGDRRSRPAALPAPRRAMARRRRSPGGARPGPRTARVWSGGRSRGRVGARGGRPYGGGGDPHPLRGRDRRCPARDAPALSGRHHRLRAHPARPRPDVPRHGQPAHAGHA